jgi:hypothetical protein
VKTVKELIDIEKFKNYPSWAIHDAIRNKEMNEIQFREWVNYLVSETQKYMSPKEE